MSCPFSDEQLAQLKAFVDLCKAQPQIVNHPKLSFFKEYLTSLGVTIPTATFEHRNFSASGDTNGGSLDTEDMSSGNESDEESDVELDMKGVISDSLEATQDMGDDSKEVTDEERDLSDEKRLEATKSFYEQKFEDAIVLYTEAIKLNPQSSMLFAKRGQVFLKLNKLHACIKDCTRALELNCDSATAYKFRGRAYRLLGKFEEASHDLCESLKIDYEDQTNEWLAEVKPNAEKLRQHKLSVQRKKEEKERREKLHKFHKAQEAHANAARDQDASEPTFQNIPPRYAGSIPDVMKLLSDPDISAAFKDPEITNAFFDVSSNPANLAKYQNNPKVAGALQLLKEKFVSAGGDFPGFGGAAQPGDAAQNSADDDVGLD